MRLAGFRSPSAKRRSTERGYSAVSVAAWVQRRDLLQKTNAGLVLRSVRLAVQLIARFSDSVPWAAFGRLKPGFDHSPLKHGIAPLCTVGLRRARRRVQLFPLPSSTPGLQARMLEAINYAVENYCSLYPDAITCALVRRGFTWYPPEICEQPRMSSEENNAISAPLAQL